MLTITRDNLQTLLHRIKGTTFATIVAEVEPQLKAPKSNPLYGRLVKRTKANVTLGFHYQSSVNRQRVREESEADFQAFERKWGARIQGTPLVYHKGSYYLECKIEKVFSSEYFVDEKSASYDDVKDFLASKSTSSRQDVEKQVILRDYKLDNIVEIHVFGNSYHII